MNKFEFSGKVTHIADKSRESGHGITVTHYPESVNDGYSDVGFVVPADLWLKKDIRLYDTVVLKGHFIKVITNGDTRKSKLLHVIDEVVSIFHEGE